MLNSAGCLHQMPTPTRLCVQFVLGHRIMYCQGLSLRTKVRAGMWPGETVIPLLLWCVCVRSGTLHQAICDDKAALFLLPFDMQQERNACHAMQQASLPVYSPQRPDMTITMQIHLSVLPDT